jgi:predicted dehydrogenase
VLVRNLLIGCGSVGKKHLSKLIELGQKIWVVDPSKDARKFALAQGDLVLGVFPTLESFLEAEATPLINLAVIANWGPDHFYAFEKIKGLHPRAIIIEKPVISKLSDLNLMKTYLKDSKASIFVNFHLRFDSGYSQLLEFCAVSKYGTPKLISVVGGAKCVSTNGIHWLDFSNELIASEWDSIDANLTSQSINPRSKDLHFYEGFTNITYKNKSVVSVNFTNSSYMDIQVTIIWKQAKGIIVDGFLKIYEADNEIPEDQPITRSARFSKKILEIPFAVDGFDQIYNRIGSVKGYVMERALEANELLILSLISSRTASQVKNQRLIPQELINLDWKVS